MNPAVAAWGAEVVIITIRDLSGSHRLPVPSEFLATFVVFGILGALGATTAGRKPAAAVGWGLVLATLLAGKVDLFKPFADFLAPSPPSAAQVQQAASNTR